MSALRLLRTMRPLGLVALLLSAGCDRLGQARGVDLERMMEQPRYDPYEVGPEFPDGRVLQHPPEGTVPRHRIVGKPLLTRGVGADDQPIDEIPVPVTAELLELGRKNYGIFCAACHGAGGYGGSLVAANMQPPLPPSLVTGHGAEHVPGHYYAVITRGQGRMPPYAAELTVAERWAVVAYLVRVLQQPHPLGDAERLDSLRGETLRRRFPEAGGGHGGSGAGPAGGGGSQEQGQGHGHAHEH